MKTKIHGDTQYEAIKKEVLEELKKQFRPEFINRVDEIIVFHKLIDEEISQIADIMIENVSQRLKEKNITLKVDKSAKELIVKKGTDKIYGARPLRRAIQTMLEDKLAEELIEGNIKEGDTVKVSEKDGEIKIIKQHKT